MPYHRRTLRYSALGAEAHHLQMSHDSTQGLLTNNEWMSVGRRRRRRRKFYSGAKEYHVVDAVVSLVLI